MKTRIWLYSVAYPKGFLHEDVDDQDIEDMTSEEGGWFDHPSKVPGAPESMKNLTGGDTNVRPRAGRLNSEVRYTDEDLRAMFLSGKKLNGSQLARLANALELAPEGADENALAQLISDALTENDPPTAGTSPSAKRVKQAESPVKPLAPAKGEPKKAPAKKASAKK